MVSLNATSLFTCFPTTEALRRRLIQDQFFPKRTDSAENWTSVSPLATFNAMEVSSDRNMNVPWVHWYLKLWEDLHGCDQKKSSWVFQGHSFKPMVSVCGRHQNPSGRAVYTTHQLLRPTSSPMGTSSHSWTVQSRPITVGCISLCHQVV